MASFPQSSSITGQLEQARADLVPIQAAIRLFEASSDPKKTPRYMDLHRVLKRGETQAIFKLSLVAKGHITSVERNQELMKPRKLEAGDTMLSHALNMRVINSLGTQELEPVRADREADKV